LDLSAQTLQAVISAYAVASAGFLLLGGRASDLLGARAVQGFGGALVFPSTLALINTTFAEGRERNRAVAVWGGAGAAGLVIGVLLGGVLTQALGWEAVFFVNVPLVAIALVTANSSTQPAKMRSMCFCHSPSP
jgi:MFS family permease